jgi:hypothetical protein
MTKIALASAMLAGALQPEPGSAGKNLYLLFGSVTDPVTAREAIRAWSSFQGRREIALVVTDWGKLERELLAWVDAVPRGVEIPLVTPEGIAMLRRYGVRRLPCFLWLDGGRVHRTYGIPKEVSRCPR